MSTGIRLEGGLLRPSAQEAETAPTLPRTLEKEAGAENAVHGKSVAVVSAGSSGSPVFRLPSIFRDYLAPRTSVPSRELAAQVEEAQTLVSFGAPQAALRIVRDVNERYLRLSAERQDANRPLRLVANVMEAQILDDPDRALAAIRTVEREHPGTPGLDAYKTWAEKLVRTVKTAEVMSVIEAVLAEEVSDGAEHRLVVGNGEERASARNNAVLENLHTPHFESEGGLRLKEELLPEIQRMRAGLSSGTLAFGDLAGSFSPAMTRLLERHGALQDIASLVRSSTVKDMETVLISRSNRLLNAGRTVEAVSLLRSLSQGKYFADVAGSLVLRHEAVAERLTSGLAFLRGLTVVFAESREEVVTAWAAAIPMIVLEWASMGLATEAMPAVYAATESVAARGLTQFAIRQVLPAAFNPLASNPDSISPDAYFHQFGHGLGLQLVASRFAHIEGSPWTSRALNVGVMASYDAALNPANREMPFLTYLGVEAGNAALAEISGGVARRLPTPRAAAAGAVRMGLRARQSLSLEGLFEPTRVTALGALAAAGCSPEGMALDPFSLGIGVAGLTLLGAGLALMRGRKAPGTPTEAPVASTAPEARPSVESRPSQDSALTKTDEYVAVLDSVPAKIESGAPMAQVFEEAVAALRQTGISVGPRGAEAAAIGALVKAAMQNPEAIPDLAQYVKEKGLPTAVVLDQMAQQVFEILTDERAIIDADGWAWYRIGIDPRPQTTEALNRLLLLADELPLEGGQRLHFAGLIARHPNASLQGCLEFLLGTPSSGAAFDARVMDALEKLAHRFPELGNWMDASQEINQMGAEGNATAALAFVRARAMNDLFFPTTNTHAVVPLAMAGAVNLHGIAEFLSASVHDPVFLLGVASVSFLGAAALLAKGSQSPSGAPVAAHSQARGVGSPVLSVETHSSAVPEAVENVSAEPPVVSEPEIETLPEADVVLLPDVPVVVSRRVLAPFIGMDARRRNGQEYGADIPMTLSFAGDEGAPQAVMTVNNVIDQAVLTGILKDRAEAQGLSVTLSGAESGGCRFEVKTPEGAMVVSGRIEIGQVPESAEVTEIDRKIPDMASSEGPTRVYGGRHWGAAENPMNDMESDGVLHTARPLDAAGETGDTPEGNLAARANAMPGLSRQLGIAVNDDGTVTYPNAVALNVRLERSGAGFRVSDVTGVVDPEVAAEALAKETPEFPYARSGSEHYHDLAIHLYGYAALPRRILSHLQQTARRLLDDVRTARTERQREAARETLREFIANVDEQTGNLSGHLASGRNHPFAHEGVMGALSRLMNPFGGRIPTASPESLAAEAWGQAEGNVR